MSQCMSGLTLYSTSYSSSYIHEDVGYEILSLRSKVTLFVANWHSK